MASAPTMTSDIKKLSFAKVAASSSKETVPIVSTSRAPMPATYKDQRTQKPSSSAAIAVGTSTMPNGRIPVKQAPAAATAPTTVKATQAPLANMRIPIEDFKGLKIDAKMPSLVVNGTGSASTDRSSKTGNSQTPSDDVSQKADSSSELGTKPPSLDGKSITSGTTFNALDEKESLRPDDSASVKAAAEDEDAFSIRGSLIAGSRMGSEVAARVHRIQLGDMPPRTITTHIVSETLNQGIVTPPSGSSEQQPVTDAKIALVAATSTPGGLYRQNPDDKLLEAMQVPKDRLFLLRLEKDVIDFVQDSKEPYMDLPPCNSFCRMLTHKLADYYHMTHSFEAVAGAVRIYRTPFCRVPPSLASIAVDSSASSTPPPALLPKKIMRRGEDGELAPVSASPSKPTSEVGSDARGKSALAKEKLSREEREEAYNKARERIFGSSVQAEGSTPENEDSTGVSRASSVSTKDKSSLGKKAKPGKQRRDDSEAFESRSQYTAYYGHPQQATWVSPQYIPAGNPGYNGQAQQPYPNAMPPAYGPPNQAYPTMMPPNNGFAPPYNAMPTYPQQATPPRYQAQAPSVPIQGYPQPVQGSPQQQSWPQPGFSQSPYPSRNAPGAPGIPYAYGQLPANANPNDPKSQHPIPGSYQRHGFNPKTQSFVPANGMNTMQAPPVPYSGYGPSQGSPQVTPPHLNYSGYQPPPPLPPMAQPPYSGSGNGYGMMRQGSNNSLPPYHAPPQHAVQHMPMAPQMPPHQLPQNPSHVPNKPNMPQGPSVGNQTFSHLPTYGNPASLPQKPST